MQKADQGKLRHSSLTKIGAALDRSFSMTIAITDIGFAVVALGIVCSFCYLRESILAYRLAALISLSFFMVQLLCNKWLRTKHIAIQTALLNLFLTAVAVAAIERHVWRESILVLIFALMSVRYLVEIVRRLREGKILAGAPGVTDPR
jgi:hypothetical protein